MGELNTGGGNNDLQDDNTKEEKLIDTQPFDDRGNIQTQNLKPFLDSGLREHFLLQNRYSLENNPKCRFYDGGLLSHSNGDANFFKVFPRVQKRGEEIQDTFSVKAKFRSGGMTVSAILMNPYFKVDWAEGMRDSKIQRINGEMSRDPRWKDKPISPTKERKELNTDSLSFRVFHGRNEMLFVFSSVMVVASTKEATEHLRLEIKQRAGNNEYPTLQLLENVDKNILSLEEFDTIRRRCCSALANSDWHKKIK